jgi:hypothetical protein
MGRNIKVLDEDNLFDFFIRKSAVKDINKLISLIKLYMTTNQQVIVGLDKINDVIEYDHYHLRGYTRYTSSGLKTFMKKPEIMSLFTDDIHKPKYYSLLSKVPNYETINEYFRYCIKDTLIYNNLKCHKWLELNTPLAKKEYKYKLDQKRKKQKTTNNRIELKDYLDNYLKNKYSEEVDYIDYFHYVRLAIMSYCKEFENNYYLSKNNLKRYSISYVSGIKNLSPEQMLHLVDNF